MLKLWAILIALTLSIGNPSSLAAQVIDLSLIPDANKKSLDRRSDLRPEAWRMAVFMARDGDPGHAYVALMSFREDINGFVTNGVWGLYPFGGDLGKWGLKAVPGGLDLTKSDIRPDAALLVWINPDQFQAIEAVAAGYDEEGTWQLLFSDCVSLMADSARAAELSTPLLTLEPYPFLRGLMSGNS